MRLQIILINGRDSVALGCLKMCFGGFFMGDWYRNCVAAAVEGSVRFRNTVVNRMSGLKTALCRG